MKLIHKIIIAILLGFAVGIITMELINVAKTNKLNNEVALYEIVILNDFINVREHPTTSSKKVYQVIKNEGYEVIEEFDDGMYTWYKIVYNERLTGWVAGSNTDKWIEEVE